MGDHRVVSLKISYMYNLWITSLREDIWNMVMENGSSVTMPDGK